MFQQLILRGPLLPELHFFSMIVIEIFQWETNPTNSPQIYASSIVKNKIYKLIKWSFEKKNKNKKTENYSLTKKGNIDTKLCYATLFPSIVLDCGKYRPLNG